MKLTKHDSRNLAFPACLGVAAFISTHAVSAQTGSPSPLVPRTAAGPIAIDSCEAIKTNNQMGFGNVMFNGHAVYFFKVSFTNTSTATADTVAFRIDNNADRFSIVDAGTYAPGSTVTHTLRSSAKNAKSAPRPGGSGPVACAVTSAHFTDGSTWTAPADPAPTSSP